MSLAFYSAYPDRVTALLIIDTGPGFRNDEAREAWNKNALATASKLEAEGLSLLKSRRKERRASVAHLAASSTPPAACSRKGMRM
jgi:hypothetical protein